MHTHITRAPRFMAAMIHADAHAPVFRVHAVFRSELLKIRTGRTLVLSLDICFFKKKWSKKVAVLPPVLGQPDHVLAVLFKWPIDLHLRLSRACRLRP